MTSFEFATAGRILFGSGRAKDLSSIVASLGSRVFLCTGSRPEAYAGLLAEPAASFSVSGEPTVELAQTATAAARGAGADVVVAIGGGSVLDLGKTVAMLLANGGDPLDYLEVVGRGQPIREPATPYVAVPTTAGTGAEVTANAVLGAPDQRLKASLRSPLMLPRVAVVDPLLTLACPPAVTASSGLDALTQCLEPYVSIRANPITDSFAREGLRRAASGLRPAYDDGGDLHAREDMALCSVLGGLALANAKLGAVHGFAGVLGGTIAAPHGVICAALLVPVVEANVEALRRREPGIPALDRYREAARLLTGRAEATMEEGIEWLSATVDRLAVPRLGALGLSASDADDVVAKAARASSMQGNPIPLSEDELHRVLAAAL